MNHAPLDNPFHAALSTIHAGIAQHAGDALRYPADVAPFLGIPHAGTDVRDALETLVAPGDTALLLGIAPNIVPSGWQLEAFDDLAQMQCTVELPVIDGPAIISLDETHRDDVLALTALVYPHYFRRRTMVLGRYFGMYAPDASGNVRLAAIIGERLGTQDAREMSAICTHPGFLGRGYARRLTAYLTNRTLREGKRPFLHVAYSNARAKALYEAMGYRLRRDIPFWAIRRRV